MKTATGVISFLYLLVAILLNPAIAKPLVLDWDALLPDDGKGTIMSIPKKSVMIGALKRGDYSDLSDEEFQETLEFYEDQRAVQRAIQEDNISIRSDLDGKSIKIAGYITPVEIDGEDVTGFLLVPYLGACIHVPAPPGNQIVYVSNVSNLKLENIYDPIWVTGTLKAKPLATIYAEVGYRIEDAKIQAYE